MQSTQLNVLRNQTDKSKEKMKSNYLFYLSRYASTTEGADVCSLKLLKRIHIIIIFQYSLKTRLPDRT